jgi:ComF family protein
VPILLKQLWKGIDHLFFPKLCEGCGKPFVGSEAVLCIACENTIPETGDFANPLNEASQRFAGRVGFQHAASLAYFAGDGILQQLMHGLKYRNRKDIGVFLGRKLGVKLQEAGWLNEVDMIVPVPLHSAKEAARGYNQALLIAQGISSVSGTPVSSQVLLRGRATESQTRKTRIDRVKNMEGAFVVADAQAITGKHILLCDDVLTTGATLEACALALMNEKSVKISLATIGIAVS